MSVGSADTIFAPASAVGRFAITVVRVSGPRAGEMLSVLCRGLPAPRRAVVRSLQGTDGPVLDRAMVLWLPGPTTYTGEDSFELHLHGGLAVMSGVAKDLLRLGARPAEPGEFSRRAFAQGRMDLLEAEAVADLIAAETVAQRDQALRQLGGALGTVYRDWSARLLRLLAQQEALIDFPDEDLPADVEEALVRDITLLQGKMAVHLQDDRRGERLRDGLVFAIAGPPNVGKSSLINALCQRDIAIVSPTPGTTRDVLEVRLDLGGVPVTLLDTAGLRETNDPIEAEGVRRARARLADAHLGLMLDQPPYGGGTPNATDELPKEQVWIATKSDLAGSPPPDWVAVSTLTGSGLDTLIDLLTGHARRLAGVGAAPMITRTRHRAAVQAASGHLAAGLETRHAELRGEELRLALNCLGRITGQVGIEEILDSVFGQFCIGK